MLAMQPEKAASSARVSVDNESVALTRLLNLDIN